MTKSKEYLRFVLVVVAVVVAAGMIDKVFGPSHYDARSVDLGSGWIR